MELATEVAERCREHHVFEDHVLNEFTAVFSDNRPLFDDITVPSLVHNDLWDPNVLVSRGHDRELHIAALVDASNRMMQTGASKMACSS